MNKYVFEITLQSEKELTSFDLMEMRSNIFSRLQGYTTQAPKFFETNKPKMAINFNEETLKYVNERYDTDYVMSLVNNE